ncbi:MAG: AAA family ATPase [Deltaproteobacteria bacterium]|nr:AAA family ATPase [Deltaproteobacteria bacterium]NMD40901.1 AAA family ATPase [Deltaproteobacteria bacterium]
MDVPDTTRIALCGKGGVGKTSVAAIMVKLLSGNGRRKVLAIDADPACGLAVALGVTVLRTVDDIRKDLIDRLRQGMPQAAPQTLRQLDYEVFGALHEQDGFAMLAIGRPEDEGCFCKVNSLLKDIIVELAGSFDVVVIDGEAGVEQINRRVMKTVDHLVLVSDTSAKGIGVAGSIAHVAADNRAVDFTSMGLVLNRVKDLSEVDDIRTRTGLPIYGWIAEDDLIREFDFRGRSLTELPETSFALGVVADILGGMGLLGKAGE